MIENTGQVKADSPFGYQIARYAADPRFTRYLEIGTWNGKGSTFCFYQGFLKRTAPFHLQSYEIVASRVEEAKDTWRVCPNIEVIHGRMLENHECPTIDQVNRIHSNQINPVWHAEDMDNFWRCPYVPMNDPQVILLDGAEYLTWFEFQKMIQTTRATVYLLDDTEITKCQHIVRWFSEHPEWTHVAGSRTERNGWAVFEKMLT